MPDEGTDELEDLRELLEPPSLTLPIGGRKYRIVECSAKTYLRLQTVSEQMDGKQISDDNEAIFDTDMWRLALGDVFDEMLPHVTGGELALAGMTAFFWQTGNHALAKIYWQSAGKGRAAPRTTSTSTAAASGTPSTAGSITRSPKKSSAAAKRAPASRRRGKSSGTGG